MRTLTFTVSQKHEGKTIATFLRQEQHFSASLCALLKKEEEYLLKNGVPVWQNATLSAGDELTIRIPAVCTLSPNTSLTAPIVYEDDDLILYDKPPGMPVHPSHGHWDDTLGNAYAAHLQRNANSAAFSPVTRLDKDTSGLCLVAKHPLSAALLSHGVKKEYLALVCGVLPEDTGSICEPIAREEGSVIKRQVSPNGKPSRTDYQVLRRFTDRTLVRIGLRTGRTHQIRVHFSHLGYPLAGDALYGGDCTRDAHHCLCCVSLSFQHPISRKILSFRKPVASLIDQDFFSGVSL